MTIHMENPDKLTLAGMKEFVQGNRQVDYTPIEPQRVYGFVERVLAAHRYSHLSKEEKGIVRQFLNKVTGLSRAQMTRLIGRWMIHRCIAKKPPQRPSFFRRYTASDIALLARVDAAHGEPSGPALRHLFGRELGVFGNQQFERLAAISVSHIYNLRNGEAYGKLRVRMQHTQARQVSIGERRQPQPQGKPGYVRVDTVHQGHQDGKPGVFHINSVDTVTQWEVVGCVETISERHLLPVLEAILHQFPFRILGFHCDNGSEFINHNVAKMLTKLQAEFTKSRAYRTTDNAQVEGKNGAVVRKHIGYGPIGSEHAQEIQKFYTAHLTSYLNFHRPCGFATVTTDKRGRRKRAYKKEDYKTPFEKLTSLKNWTQYLKPGVSEAWLREQAGRMSDTEAAEQMQKAKQAVLERGRGKR
jgi:hypothetical protein